MIDNVIFELKGISYTYPAGQQALDNVSIKVYKGEFLGIVGPNGAGKSTLLMIMDALINPDEGIIYAFGNKLTRTLLKNKHFLYNFRRRVGFVFQDPDIQLFSSTVWNDVAFGPIHMRTNHMDVKHRVEKALKNMDIQHLAFRHPYNLSVGEKKKASIATVLSIDPEVIILDEPTANLDRGGKRELIKIVRRLHSNGKTFIVATHDLDFVFSLADRLYILNKTIISEGSPSQIISNQELLENNEL